ncbi:MAG: DUF1292 domain-containing protein [Clostridiales bacterium]|nr:DUF1292 domain-containing protein [Clostridiales bacterium]
MSEELDYTVDLYTLVDEDGKEQTFEMLDAMQVEEQDYYALTPYYGEDADATLQDDGELVILKAAKDENGEDIMISIDDDDEFEKIGALFMERIEEMFDLDECDCGDDDCDCHLN